MMRFARTVFFVVALVLLTLAGIASAECAWVLWIQENEGYIVAGTKLGTWERWAVYNTRAECETSRNREMEGQKQALQEDEKRSPNERLGYKSLRYQCWPDTVDLRGPKAK